ncbi:TonB-dependent receptor plug domain-containing protein [Opitutus terrae]|uniref:TonB-dependent receptor plug n=1 Tax=Opitutus terrae (strain DSM 11246 / JCM 15787 / PB90-1) TaxID=452637 RepID=B1ZVG8_OPITP|nr:TonB-dependent receptor [Opitutus terrae]ACB74065.1 TonB-dependent receptor plug [Opitutus terrae PB90-1]
MNRRRSRARRWIPGLRGLAVAGLCHVAAAHAQTPLASAERMQQLSLEELLSLEVTTMSRKTEPWWTAPGAVEVLTSEEIRRSTARNLPEALRLATGLDVAQSSARSWAISARGFNVLAANKISVLLDGRSLFTPFFSGVQWDAQDTLLADVDRIEVVRGPVGALWGAFAVNGFVQIVTKPADDTQGWLVSGGAGTEDPGFLAVRYGGRIGRRAFYRVYAKYFDTDWTYLANGRHAQPSTDFGQVGFRADALLDADTSLTVQGDAYTNKGLPQDREQAEISGGNLLARIRRTFSAASDLEVMSYYDRTARWLPTAWLERRDTGALTAKFRYPLDRHDLLVGADVHVSRDDIANLGFATMVPPQRTTHVVGVYLQDTIAVVPRRWAVTLGAKAEHNSFSGVEAEPSLRAAWTPTPRTTGWAAVSRAVRAPVRVDQDLLLQLGGQIIVDASDAFDSESVVAYELGWRQQVGSQLTLDVAAFHNEYRDLRTAEPIGAEIFPLTFKNGAEAQADGLETSVQYQPSARLFFKASYRLLDLDFMLRPGSRAGSSFANEGNDPRHLGSLTAHAVLSHHLEFDATLRHVSSRPDPATEGYWTADLRLAWLPSESWEIALLGRNLFTGLHRELITTNSLNEFIRASGTVKITWRY